MIYHREQSGISHAHQQSEIDKQVSQKGGGGGGGGNNTLEGGGKGREGALIPN